MGIHLSQLKTVVALLLLSGAALAQNTRIDNVALGPRGPIPGATVAVCTQPANTSTTPCSPLANLCSSLSDAACVSPNPVTADSLGNYHFYVKHGQSPYTVQIYGPQVAAPSAIPDQTLPSSVGSNVALIDAGQYATIQAAIAACPSTDCWVLVPPGTYVGPPAASFRSHLHLTGYTSGVPAATITAASNLVWGTPPADNKVIFTYTSTLTISALWDTTIEGITFDFGGNNAGIVLTNGVFNNIFDIAIQNCGTGTALTLNGGSLAGQGVVGDEFRRLMIFNAGKGIRFTASAQSNGNHLFHYVWMNNISLNGIEFVQNADTISFDFVFMAIGNTATGVAFNTANPSVDVDADDNVIHTLITDVINGNSGTWTLLQFNQSFGNNIDNWTVGGNLAGGTEVVFTGNPSYRYCYAADYSATSNSNACNFGRNFQRYNSNIVLAGGGVPAIYGVLSPTGLVANTGPTTIYTTSAAMPGPGPGGGGPGQYMVCIALTPTATGNSTAIQAQVVAPSGAGTVTKNVGAVLNTAALTNGGGGCDTIRVAASSAIQIQTTGYNTTGTYRLDATVAQVQ